jgi:hypothetical protein
MFQCDARVLGLCRFKGLLIHISFFGHRNPAKWPPLGPGIGSEKEDPDHSATGPFVGHSELRL